MSLERTKTIVEIGAEISGVLALIVGGVFAAGQYLEKKADDRVRESLAFYDRFHGDGLRPHWERILDAWLQHDPELQQMLDDPAVSVSQLDDYVLNVVADEGLAAPIMNVADFFVTLEVCARKNVCDRATAVAFLGSDARTFYNLHYPYIRSVREVREDPDFAKELEAFANY